MRDWDRPWWMAGGWAIDAFTGTARAHEDIDIAIFRDDVPGLRSYLGQEWNCWAAGDGALTPLTEARPGLPAAADQCWVRAHAWSPWVADVVTSPGSERQWVLKRDTSVTMPLDDAIRAYEGIAYQRPEIVLAYKAKLVRAKDDADLARTWPLLDARARAWPQDTVALVHPGHRWLSRSR